MNLWTSLILYKMKPQARHSIEAHVGNIRLAKMEQTEAVFQLFVFQFGFVSNLTNKIRL